MKYLVGTKTFDNIEDAKKAEVEAAKSAELTKKKNAKKKARAAEVEKAQKSAEDAIEHYNELKNQFIKDYGTWFSVETRIDDKPTDIFDSIFNFPFWF